ncbi:MAG: hypothetical protein J5773_04215 [Verrucomicrobia bacterium]|nr:hypothetical protein [Verrucomicrobiota bacterium]MBR5978106.1 hypothetical protein [Verrucomicrobiota bacterium]
MKKFYIFIILCIITFGLTVALIAHIRSSNEKTLAQQEAQWNQEKAEILAELEALKIRMDELKTNVPEQDSPELEPKALIARFREMKDWIELFGDTVDPLSKIRGIKPLTNEISKTKCHDQVEEAFFIFQGLQNQGDKSLDAIRDYLTSGDNFILYRNNDPVGDATYFHPVHPSIVEYNRTDSEGNVERVRVQKPQVKKPFLYRFRGTVYNIDPVPETSRLGLIYTLGSIKTPAALGLLYQSMQSSTNLKEIISAGNLLLDADKGSFAQPVLSVYKARFPVLSHEEQNSLLSYIKKISEKDFKELVQTLTPVDEDGKLAVDILCLKMECLGEEGIPEAYEALKRPDLSLMEKINIVDSVRKFVGANEQANSMLTSFINGLDEIDRDYIGSCIIMNITENTQGKERQQQLLTLLNQFPQKQEDQSFFTETLGLMKETLTDRIEQGENFDSTKYRIKVQTVESDYQRKLDDKMSRLMHNKTYAADIINMLSEYRAGW